MKGPGHGSLLGRAAAFCFALAVLTSIPSPGAAPQEWRSRSRDSITVVFRPEDARAASRFLDIAVLATPRIASDLGLGQRPAYQIVVAPDDEEFRRLTERGVPDWGVGCAYPKRRLIIVRSPRLVESPLHMEEVIPHEIAHIVAGLVLGDIRVPRWFDEGVAMVESREWRTGQAATLALAVANGTAIRLSDLETAFPVDAGAAGLAYIESFYAVRFLMEEAGHATPGPLVRAVARSGDFGAALREFYGGGTQELDRGFEELLRTRFSWALLLYGWRLFFLLATLLFLVAFVLRVRRSHGTLRRWEAEESGAPKAPGAD